MVSNEESEFARNTLRICQEIQNRFYSERIKLGDVDPEEPWWFSKVALIAKNAELVLSDASATTAWTSDFNPLPGNGEEWRAFESGAKDATLKRV